MSTRAIIDRVHGFFWYGAQPGTSASARFAERDLMAVATHWRVWARLGWHDIRQRYQRTVLGPFWITISMAAMVGSLGLVFSAIFKNEIADYLPFLASGLITWNFISVVGGDSPSAFVSAHGLIKSVPLPFTVHVCRVVARNLFIFGHNLIAFLAVMIIFDVPVTANTLLFVPGVLLLTLNTIWVCIIVAIVGARFRDIQQIVAIVLQFVFFLTPIIWDRGQIKGGRLYWVDVNPFYHLVDIVRAPMLGRAPAWDSYVYACAMLAAGGLLCYFVFRYYRRRIAYWV